MAYIKYLSVSLDALELLWSSARVSGGEAALWVRIDSKHAEFVDGGERLRVPIAERLTHPLQRLPPRGLE